MSGGRDARLRGVGLSNVGLNPLTAGEDDVDRDDSVVVVVGFCCLLLNCW